jgi:hypothetical protein
VAYQCILKKASQPHCSNFLALHILQFLPHSPNPESHPAMEAGVTDHVWSLEEVVGLLETEEKRAAA